MIGVFVFSEKYPIFLVIGIFLILFLSFLIVLKDYLEKVFKTRGIKPLILLNLCFSRISLILCNFGCCKYVKTAPKTKSKITISFTVFLFVLFHFHYNHQFFLNSVHLYFLLMINSLISNIKIWYLLNVNFQLIIKNNKISKNKGLAFYIFIQLQFGLWRWF